MFFIIIYTIRYIHLYIFVPSLCYGYLYIFIYTYTLLHTNLNTHKELSTHIVVVIYRVVENFKFWRSSLFVYIYIGTNFKISDFASPQKAYVHTHVLTYLRTYIRTYTDCLYGTIAFPTYQPYTYC